MNITSSVATSLVSAVIVAACGGGGKSDNDKITDIIKEGGKNPSTICDHLDAKILKTLGGKDGCVKAAKADDSNKDPAVKINEIKIDGDKATAKVKGAQGDQTINFIKEDGDWKVTATS